jgi:hypothetical protein
MHRNEQALKSWTMAKVTIYRQVRFDGGVRTGLAIDGTTLLHDYRPGTEDDAAVLWFVDLRFHEQQIPRDAELAREWLLAHAGEVKIVILSAADHLALGFDDELKPYDHVFQSPAIGRIRVVASAIRRIDAQAMSQHLRELAAHFESDLRELRLLEAV